MRIITPPIIIDETDSFKNDVLDRKAFGEALLNLVQRSNDELVISLDGKWGEGKTTFVKMWQGLLTEANIPNIYIDAFANDYIDDAFISVISAITSYAENNIEKENTENIDELKDKAKKVGGHLLSWSAKIAVKAATLGVIKEAELEELNDIKSDLAKDASSAVSNYISDRLISHSSDVKLIKAFKNTLSELPAKFVNNDGNSLIIIIDELDRCKPPFAVEMLEKIKHLFSVKNIVFVLVMHKEQLEEAVKCVYGQNMDAHTYLQKFISIETAIPKRTEDRYVNDINKYCQRLHQLHELETWGDDRNIIDCIEPLANHFNLSLRQLEKVYTNLAVFYASSSNNSLRIVPLVVFLAIVKVAKPEIFKPLTYKKITYVEICEETGLNHEQDEHRKLHWLMGWVRYATLSESEFQKLSDEGSFGRYGESLWDYSVEREGLIPLFAQQLNMFVAN